MSKSTKSNPMMISSNNFPPLRTQVSNQIDQVRENSIKKDNWNLFVGDVRYKTNFFLNFQDPSLKTLFDNHLLPSSYYSIRLFIILICIVDLFLLDKSIVEHSFFSRIFVVTLMLCSIFATTRPARMYHLLIQQSMLLLLPMTLSYRALTFSETYKLQAPPADATTKPIPNEPLPVFLISLVFYLPTFLMSLFVIPSWIEYLVRSVLQSIFLGILTGHSTFTTFKSFPALALYVTVFAFFEKVRKEQFVIGYTNAKTKRFTMQLLNQLPQSVAVVNRKGQLMLYNTGFEQLIRQRLGAKIMPQNIFRMANEEDGSMKKLQDLVEDSTKNGGQGKNKEGDQNPLQKIEVMLVKSQYKGKSFSPLSAMGKKSPTEIRKEMEETKSSIERAAYQKDMFEKFEVAIVKADHIVYNAQKSAMLTFDVVSEQKAKNHLLYLHSQALIKFLIQFNKRLQQLFSKLQSDEQQSQEFVEFIGSLYLVMNRIQQIQHELADMPDSGKNPEENFILKEEILQIVESLSVKCLSQTAQLKLDANKYLPEKLAGDVSRFRLAVQSIVEFSTKYCKEGMIDFHINFDGMTGDQKYMISFDIIFDRTNQFNDEPLIKMLNNLSKCPKQLLNEALISNYEDFFDLIVNFGIGIIIFPSLIQALQGTYSISIVDQNSRGTHPSQSAMGTMNHIFNGVPSESIAGDSSQIMRSQTRVKVNFKLPFSSSDSGKKIVSPYFPFNPYIEEQNGKKIYKSPLLKTREYNRQARDEMKRIMGEQQFGKSPLAQARPIKSNLPQLSPFAQLLGNKDKPSVDQGSSNMVENSEVQSNNYSQQVSQKTVGNASAAPTFNNNMNGPLLKNSQFESKKTTEDIVPVTRKVSNSLYQNQPGQNRKQIQKIESTLLTFEKDSQPKVQQNFFGVQKIVPTSVTPQPNRQIVTPVSNIEAQSIMNYDISKEDIKTLQNPLSKDDDSAFDDKQADPINQLKMLSGMGQKQSMQDVNSQVQVVSALPPNMRNFEKRESTVNNQSLSQEFEEQKNSQKEEHNSKMNFIGGNVLSRIESKIGDIFQRNVGSMFSPQLEHDGNQQIQKNDNKKDSQARVPTTHDLKSGSQMNIKSGNDFPRATSVLGTQPNQSSGLGLVQPKKSLFSKNKNNKQIKEVSEGNEQDKLQQTFKLNLEEMNRPRGASVFGQKDFSPMNMQGHITVPSGIPKDLIGEEKKDDFLIKKPLTDQIVLTDNQPTPNHQTISGSSINGLSEGGMSIPKPKIVGTIIEEEVKMALNKKNSILQKVISANHMSSMNEGAENFQTERMVEEDVGENIRQISNLNVLSAQNQSRIDVDSFLKNNNDLVPMSNQMPRELLNNSSTLGASKNKLAHSRMSTPQQKALKTQQRDLDSQHSNLIIRGHNSYLNNAPPKSYVESSKHAEIRAQMPQMSDIKQSGAKKSFEVEETKQSVIAGLKHQPFKYHRGRETLIKQEQLKRDDYEQQGHIVLWDHKEESKLKKKREESKGVESANVSQGWGASAAGGAHQVQNPLVPTGNYQYFQNNAKTIDTSKRYILVVEDNCMITMILQVTLENMGVTAVIAENGKIGVEKFLSYVQQGCLFEMIIMDILMPVMGGYDATKEIRKIEDQYKVAREDRHFICGFSADVSAVTTQKCKEAGMNHILPKPMDNHILKELVEKYKRPSALIKTAQPQEADHNIVSPDSNKQMQHQTNNIRVQAHS